MYAEFHNSLFTVRMWNDKGAEMSLTGDEILHSVCSNVAVVIDDDDDDDDDDDNVMHSQKGKAHLIEWN